MRRLRSPASLLWETSDSVRSALPARQESRCQKLDAALRARVAKSARGAAAGDRASRPEPSAGPEPCSRSAGTRIKRFKRLTRCFIARTD